MVGRDWEKAKTFSPRAPARSNMLSSKSTFPLWAGSNSGLTDRAWAAETGGWYIACSCCCCDEALAVDDANVDAADDDEDDDDGEVN